MSEHESEAILENLNKKLFKQNKLLTTITEKLEELLKQKPVANNTNEDDKEKIEKAFEKRGIGRPAGNWDSKRIQYLKMLKDGKIKEPKASTLEFYKIIKDGDKYEFLDD